MKLPFKRVKEIIVEEIDSLSVLEEATMHYRIMQQKGEVERLVKAGTSDIEFEWGRKDRNSRYGMDPYLMWAPRERGGMPSTLGELQWRGDPFTYEKITDSSRSNPKVRVVTGPSSRADAIGRITTIKSQPRIDAWWKSQEIIQDDLPTPEKKTVRPEVEEETAGYGMYKNLASAVLKLREALRKDWKKDGLDYDTESENVYSLLLRVNNAIFGPYEAGSLNFGGQTPPGQKLYDGLEYVSDTIADLVVGVGPNLKRYYVATGSDPFPGFLMSDAVQRLTFDVVSRSIDLLKDLDRRYRATSQFVPYPDLYKLYNGPPLGMSGRWWQYEEEQAEEEVDRGVGVFVRDVDDVWQEFQSEDGKTWYYNKETEESVWSMPIIDRISQWWNDDDEDEVEVEDTGDYQESFKISSQRLSQLIKEELQLIVEAQDPQTQDTGEEYLGVAAPAIKADKTKRLRTMRASIAALTSKINKECGASGDSSSCDSDKDQLSDLQTQEQELAQS